METRRLELLLALSRLGSMREVADAGGMTTSTVSQQLAALAREVGTPLLEPDGRRVRLTPAGRRLADHAVGVLAAVEAARLDLDPDAVPAGVVRVAGFATAVRRDLMPVVRDLAATHPGVQLQLHEFEPPEALARLAADEVDLALVYDYALAPVATDAGRSAVELWSSRWGLGAPGEGEQLLPADRDAAAVCAVYRNLDWIVNSRNTADEVVLRILGAQAGFVPRITHQVDSLELVQEMIVAGLGVGLLPQSAPTVPGVAVLPLRRPDVRLRARAVTRRGSEGWAPLALVLDRLVAGAARRSDPWLQG
ncbi:LysR family transcriptional regulator [Nakamurella sp. YIM 132087]|uniref:LysR family transcriptional regulator n=1 Tax=Nakamurella alba TaxID=2665158 RepID=A0A7K1FQX8_9ACTN|nr:LysR substrate-binding domain-containing protein [Nakamurella alba]MTD16552.1 LysR family transcriptional regulator [Nakamurella alba]